MRTFTRRATRALVVAITFTSIAAGCSPSREPGTPLTASASVGQGGGGSGGATAQAAGALYGDLYVVERDGNGVPALKEKTITGVKYTCQLPLAADCTFLPLNFDKSDFNPELEDACAVQAAFTDGLQEVKFGRESVSRAPATVLDKSYGEALKSINLAVPGACTRLDGDLDDRAIKLDPAGRITLCLAYETIPVSHAWKTIDAPLENLGLYRAAMTSGCLGPITDTKIGEGGVPITVTIELGATAKANLAASGLGHLVCNGSTAVTREDMLSASVFLAAGADKTSPVTLDEVINLNNYVGVNKWTYTTSKKVKTLTITYFQFKDSSDEGAGGWFAYTKGKDACDPDDPDNTVGLLTTVDGASFVPKPVSVFGGAPDGVYLRPEPGNDAPGAAVTVCRGGAPLGVTCDAGAANPVYGPDGSGCGGANWFTQAAEDARKTIWFVHNWRLPEVAY